ncbi:MAG TPA: putative Ig domain-containing protein [Planctomycetota bacterium]|nr:putative Ig domain-containing protein [Planctomycetota bacterium]
MSTASYFRSLFLCFNLIAWAFASAAQERVVDPTVPVLTSAASVNAGPGAFSYTITATNNPVSFNDTFAGLPGGLPPGLALNKGTGVISGTPTSSGTFNVLLSATSAQNVTGMFIVTFLIDLGDATQNPLHNLFVKGLDISLPGAPWDVTGSVGSPFLYGLSATGVPTNVFSAEGLPNGLSINNGIISGTPTSAGYYVVGCNVSFLSSSSFAGNSQSMRLTISAPPANTTPGNGSVTATMSESYSDTALKGDTTTVVDLTSASVSISATLSLEALSDSTPIDENTVFSIVAGHYNFSSPLGAAASLGGKLDLKHGSATFLERTSIDVTSNNFSKPPKFENVPFGSVSLKWDLKKKLLTVKAARKIPSKLTSLLSPGQFIQPCTIVCSHGDNGPYTAANATVTVALSFGASHSFLSTAMLGSATTSAGSTANSTQTAGKAAAKKATGNGQ